MGQFKLKSKMKLSDMTEADRLDESDYATLTPDGYFVQLEYLSEDKVFPKVEVKPGIYSIIKTQMGFDLKPTSYVSDSILEEFVSTKEVESIVDSFFNNIPLYAEFGIEVPKRGVLLWGPAGTGKTTVLNKCVNKYVADGKTFVLVWHTSKFDSGDVQDFIKTFDYSKHGIEKMILVAEDLGGMENEQTRMRSDSSFLS